MPNHVGYIGATILCGTCGNAMHLSDKNRPLYEPGQPIKWVVVCRNAVCPHFGVAYKVTPSVQLEEV